MSMPASVEEEIAFSVESAGSAVEWGAIIGGTLAAIGASMVLLTLGAGIGFSTVSPWSFANPSPTAFGVTAAIWLVVVQWLASAFGGYLAGRLRTRWPGPRTDEVFFRDTAHGFLAWALATLLMALFLTFGSAVAAGSAAATAQAAANVPAETADAARKVAASFSIITALSFVIGAFVASAAGALGGFQRDD